MTADTIEHYGIPAGSQYAAGMVKLVIDGIQAIRATFGDKVAKAQAGEHVIGTRHGKPVVALVSIEWYREMRKLSGDPTDI